MVSVEKIRQKFIQTDEYLSILKQISKRPKKDFMKDKILIGSAKYYLQVSIECCLDVANHIIASDRLRAPKDYADSFKVIEEEGVITPEFSQRLRQMAKFRNRLVHLYGELDDAFVHKFINEDLKDIEEFEKTIVKKYHL